MISVHPTALGAGNPCLISLPRLNLVLVENKSLQIGRGATDLYAQQVMKGEIKFEKNSKWEI